MSAVAMFLPSLASIVHDSMTDSIATVGELASSLATYSHGGWLANIFLFVVLMMLLGSFFLCS
jgi:hypothetical protein